MVYLMEQLISVLIAIAFIPILLRLKIPIGPTLIILGMFVGIFSGLDLGQIRTAFFNVFLIPDTLASVLIVIEIGMLSVLMSHYGLLNRMELAMRRLLPYPKVLMLFFPALVGVLQAPGGAALSAPLVNQIGKEMGLAREMRANINVVGRHILPVIAPFSTNMIVVHSVAPDVNIVLLGLLNLGFVVLMQVSGYFILMRNAKAIETNPLDGTTWLQAFGEFNLTFIPVYLAVLPNGLFGIPYTVSIAVAILSVFFLGGKHDFGQQVVKSFNVNLALLIIGVYFFQNIVGELDALLLLFERLASNQSNLMFLITVAVIGTIFGLATGLMYLPLGVLVPIICQASYGSEMDMMVHLFYAFIWCFIGYYFSPIHLCQLLSDKETGCTPGERYRAYIPVMLLWPVFAVVLYAVYSITLV